MDIDIAMPSDVHVPQFNKVKPSGLPRSAIEDLAETFAEAVGYHPKMKIEELVSSLGGRLSFTDSLDDLTHGSIEVRGMRDFDILLPLFTSAVRDRFTIAHEIGHYVVHYLWARESDPTIGPITASRYGNDIPEFEANWFAAAFLMPSEKVKAVWNETRSVAAVATEFNVSADAAKLRVKYLGLI